MKATDHAGPAGDIITAYSLVCHQLPSRSYFLLGQQMAYCERNTALYTTMALGGLLWARVGHRLPPLPWPAFTLLTLPIAVDGFTQLLGLRESTWQLRTLTGVLFGLSSVWFAFPIVDRLLGSTPKTIVTLSVERRVPSRERAGDASLDAQHDKQTFSARSLNARPPGWERVVATVAPVRAP